MRRNEFNDCILNRDFRELFLILGWNNPKVKDLYEDIDEQEYHFRGVAEMHGFMVLTCELSMIPSTAMCKRIDNKLRPHAQEYILIITQTGTTHHKWIVPVRNTEKRDIVTIEYDKVEKADFLFNKLGLLTVGDNENIGIQDIKERIRESFAVNSEKLTKDFFREFKQEHDRFFNFITGIDDQIKEDSKGKKKNRKKDWYTSVMLNRLMFCYFVQKKGFLNGDVNYLHNKLKEFVRAKEDGTFFQSFYRGFLCALFHDGLNSPRHQEDFKQKYGLIPYLNGGMFDEHELEKQFANIDIADEAFENLFSFFDKWEWHLDTRLTASGKDINPDVLGYIFEQYINDRAAMGAYYTKEDITEYIGKNCIIPFLMDKTEEKSRDAFKPNGFVWQSLQQSGDKYIYDAVKKGYSADWPQRIPDYVSQGIPLLPEQHNLLERRSRWNEKTHEEFALPTEIWRETVERLQRCDTLLTKIRGGKIQHINDFITYNLDIRQFAEDIIRSTDDHLYVLHFYEALQQVTILDPTCGSGAFLFAALNILEPLYEACLDRMEDFHRRNNNLFAKQLEEINTKYSSNRQYFIYKSIILRNLYGVDIMVEATEIAKLRLFLKMVAVVEVDKRKDNMGLDPLPDIDFNIKCGNTLVGYATEDELNKAMAYGDPFAALEFKEKIEEKMSVVATAYNCFRSEQLKAYDDNASIKQTKDLLKHRLVELNDLLNKHMYKAITGKDALTGEIDLWYSSWESSHQPFHWLAEFYQIIKGNGGFDVIIGNPPYLEARQIDYVVGEKYKTLDSGAVHAFCIERSLAISRGNVSMIVPIALTCTQRMVIVQKLLEQNHDVWYSNYAWRPAKLFDAVNRALSIFVANNAKENKKGCFTTEYIKWVSDNRAQLMNNLHYIEYGDKRESFWVPKLRSQNELSILKKILSQKNTLNNHAISTGNGRLYYRTTGGLYWKVFTNFSPKFYCNGEEGKSSRETSVIVKNNKISAALVGFFSSDIFWWWYTITSNLRDLNPSDIYGIHMPECSACSIEIQDLGIKLLTDLQANSIMLTREQKNKGTTQTQSFKIAKSKPIIDEIDKVLAKHYGFTEEELDFIINYDIKYRMGDELNNEE